MPLATITVGHHTDAVQSATFIIVTAIGCIFITTPLKTLLSSFIIRMVIASLGRYYATIGHWDGYVVTPRALR